VGVGGREGFTERGDGGLDDRGGLVALDQGEEAVGEEAAGLGEEIGMGAASLASGAVRHERLAELVTAMRALLAEESAPSETTEEWVELVVAAAIHAERAGAHLAEGDDGIYGAYRWPPLDEPWSGRASGGTLASVPPPAQRRPWCR